MLETTSTLCATLDVARRADRAEIEFCALASEAGGVERLEAGGGLALVAKPGSPMNKMLGLGLGRQVTDDELDRIEHFFASRRTPAQIELCPLAAIDVPPRLCARGFVVQGFETELARTLAPGTSRLLPPTGDLRITQARPDQDELWVRVTAQGFAAFEPPVSGGSGVPEIPPVEALVAIMANFAHPRMRRYLAWVGDQPAGGGAAWVHEGVAGICGTSTLPAFRRRGIQRAITVAALEDAEGDADLAIATTAPGSTSQRTFERLGFQVLYSRAIFVKG